MLDLDTVRYNIERWVETFVEVPNHALGGWPPCPYARQARLNNEYEIRIGQDPYHDLVDIAIHGLGNKKVIILAYDPEEFEHPSPKQQNLSMKPFLEQCKPHR